MAEGVNLKVSEYLYYLAMNRSIRVESAEFRQDMRNLSAISNNLNQIATVGNKNGWIPKDMLQAIRETVAEIYKTIKSNS